MVTFNETRTLVKDGYLERDLRDALIQYRPDFFPVAGTPDRIKYGLYIPKHPSLTIVSKLIGRTTESGRNVLVLITSYEDSINQRILDELNQATGMKTIHDVSEHDVILNNRIMTIILRQLIEDPSKTRELGIRSK